MKNLSAVQKVYSMLQQLVESPLAAITWIEVINPVAITHIDVGIFPPSSVKHLFSLLKFAHIYFLTVLLKVHFNVFSQVEM